MWGNSFSTVGDTFSTVEVVQYSGDNISTVGDSFSTVEGIQYIGNNISTVEGIQYSGGRILISACLVINNDEKISTFLYYDTKFSFGSFRKSKRISCILRAGLVYSRSNLVSK